MKKIKVLLVEDEDYSVAFRRFFEQTGYFKVDVAETAADAEVLLKKTPPNIIFFDLYLEKDRQDGVVLASRIRGVKGLASVPIVIITQRKSRKEARAADAESGPRSGVYYMSKSDGLTKILAKTAMIFFEWSQKQK